MSTRIDDPSDPRIAAYSDLRDPDTTLREGRFVLESARVLRHALACAAPIESILLTPSHLEGLAADIERAASDGQPPPSIYVGTPAVLEAIAGFPIHRGVLALARRPDPETLTPDAALGAWKQQPRAWCVVAEGFTDAYNVGGLFRNAAAFGLDGVLLDPRCTDPLYRKAIRASLGHSISTRWARSRDWPADLSRLKTEWGMTLVAATPDADALPLWELAPSPRLAVVLGEEDRGLTGEALAQCDVRARIPMRDADSLNVAVASAVFFYELTRGAARS